MYFSSTLPLITALSIVVGTEAAPSNKFSKRAISPDDTCGNNGTSAGADAYSCPPSLPCCSSHGFCGSDDSFCLITSGCQPAFGNCTAPVAGVIISPDLTCGITGAGNAGYVCPPSSPCCSGNGWCGNTADYCAAASKCQPTYGTCNSTSSNTPGNSNLGTSTNGQCGPGFGTCASDQCCSFAGFCGATSDFCSAPNCQTAFGPACDANKIPSGTNTSSITRAQIGNVLYGASGVYDCVVPGTMALTFDDGPFIYTSIILDLLAKYNAKATFFITGNNNGKGEIDNTSLPWAGMISRMYSEGHQVASHTWSHPDLCKISSDERKNEMYKNEIAIRNIIGLIPTYMRPPFSSCTAECGCEDDMLALGYHISYFDLDTADYLNDSPDLIQNSKDIFSSTVANATGLNGAGAANTNFLAIAHDIHNQTANNLTEFMLQTLTGAGYKPVTIGECLGDDPANWYRTDTSSTLGTKA